MDKLLLTLTLLALSSGVLCNVAQNLIKGGPTADSVLSRTKVLGGHLEFYNNQAKCCAQHAPPDYQITRGVGAHKLHRNLLSWNQARQICMSDGGQLAVINSEAEGKMLADWLHREKVGMDVWIGIHDLFEQGHWVTLNGESLAAAGYDHWLPGEPDNAGGTEHCGALQGGGGINDLTCSRERHFFCKIILC